MTEELKGHLDSLILAVARRGARARLRDHQELKARAAAARSTLPEGTVYPALHRLERSGLLASGWSSASGPQAPRLPAHAPRPHDGSRAAGASGATSRAPSTRCSHELSRRAVARARRRTASAARRAVASSPRSTTIFARTPDARGAFRLAARDRERVRGGARRAGVAARRRRRVRGARPSRAPCTPPRSSRWRSRARRRRRSTPALGALALAAMVVAPQVAFVAGALALVRALRRRGERVMPTAELS